MGAQYSNRSPNNPIQCTVIDVLLMQQLLFIFVLYRQLDGVFSLMGMVFLDSCKGA
jgi:hypothetical protein